MSVFFNKLCIILYKNIAHAHAQFYGAHFSMYQLIYVSLIQQGLNLNLQSLINYDI